MSPALFGCSLTACREAGGAGSVALLFVQRARFSLCPSGGRGAVGRLLGGRGWLAPREPGPQLVAVWPPLRAAAGVPLYALPPTAHAQVMWPSLAAALRKGGTVNYLFEEVTSMAAAQLAEVKKAVTETASTFTTRYLSDEVVSTAYDTYNKWYDGFWAQASYFTESINAYSAIAQSSPSRQPADASAAPDTPSAASPSAATPIVAKAVPVE